ncbi:MAG: exosortase [Candidatus Eisenbacteria bacterium]|nr:exosortase [Candidatus Eisenbacteria bacterium]
MNAPASRAPAAAAPPATPGRAAPWKVLVVCLPLPFLFAETVATLWSVWLSNPNYSHGLLVPPIAAVLVWARRKELRRLVSRPSAWGAPLVAAGVGLHVFGIRGEVTFLQGYGALTVLAGLILHFGGWTWLRRLAFPLAFLAFMLPAPPLLMNQISFELKLLASRLSGAVLDGIGIPVWRNGAVLYLPAGPLAVENPCSGLRSLLALVALGALMARMGDAAPWKRVALFAAAWPAAIAANMFRVVSLGLVATFHSLEFAVGRAHDVLGFVIFGVALILLEGVRRVLRW